MHHLHKGGMHHLQTGAVHHLQKGEELAHRASLILHLFSQA